MTNTYYHRLKQKARESQEICNKRFDFYIFFATIDS